MEFVDTAEGWIYKRELYKILPRWRFVDFWQILESHIGKLEKIRRSLGVIFSTIIFTLVSWIIVLKVNLLLLVEINHPNSTTIGIRALGLF